jgi:hypothetical protein
LVPFTGDDCGEPDCPGEPNCLGQGICNTQFDPPKCTNCDDGWMGADCGTVCLYGTPNEDETVCNCTETCHHGIGCDIECSGNGKCHEDGTGDCFCDPLSGWSGTYCQIPGRCRQTFNTQV